MNHVIMIIIALAAAFGIMLLVYTKKGLLYRKEQGSNDIVTGVLIAVIVYFWESDLIAFIKNTQQSALTYLFVFGAPILIIIWAVYTRIKLKEQMKAPKKPGNRNIKHK